VKDDKEAMLYKSVGWKKEFKEMLILLYLERQGEERETGKKRRKKREIK
jgi:hypothetical protein